MCDPFDISKNRLKEQRKNGYVFAFWFSKEELKVTLHVVFLFLFLIKIYLIDKYILST